MPEPMMPSPRIATSGFVIVFLSQGNDTHQSRGRTVDLNRISERPAVTRGRDPDDVSIPQTNVVAETETVGPQKVHMHISAPAMCRVLEVMVLDVGEAVTHFRIAAQEGLVPEHGSIALDGNGNRYGVEIRINHQFRPECAGAQL